MQLKLDKRFWVVITCIIVVFTIFIVGRNLLHAIEIRKDIAILEQERALGSSRTVRCSKSSSTTIIWSNSPASAIACSGGGRKSISWNEAAFDACG